MINGFAEAVKRIKYNLEYGFHCNDLSFNDMEDDICFIFDKLAKDNGEPEIDWEEEEEDDDESSGQETFASSVPGEYIAYTETRPGHFVAKNFTLGEHQEAAND